MKSAVILLFVCGILTVPLPLKAASTEEWAVRAVQAAGQAASGNPQGAAAQVIPGASTVLPGQTQVYAGAGGVGVRQPFLPAQLQQAPVALQGAYNVYAAPNGYGTPSLGHNVQVNAASGQVQNTTTWTPPSPRLSKER